MGAKRAANMAAAGATKAEIKAANPGLSSREIKAATNTKPNDRGPAGNTAPTTSPISIPTNKQMSGGGGGGTPSVREAIKDLGSNGNLSKNEVLKISNQTGKDVDQIVRQLDKVNANSAADNKAPIGLGNAAFNSLLNTPTSRTVMGQSPASLGLSDPYNNYGSGAIGQAVMQAKGTSDFDGTSTAGTGRIAQGQQVIGSYNGAPQLQIKPQNNVNAGYYGAGTGTGGGVSTATGGGGGTGGAGGTGGGGEVAPLPLPKEELPDPIALSSGTGSTVDGTATSFRRKRSTARAAGLTSRGTGQFRNSLKVGSASGVNIGM